MKTSRSQLLPVWRTALRKVLVVCGILWTRLAVGAETPSDPTESVFGPDKLWKLHLQISAENWQAMLPTRGLRLFGAPEFGGESGKSPEGGERREPAERRGGFKFDFRYVPASVELNGERIEQVGVRFKGNSSYGMVGNSPKRPFKIDFDRQVEGQTFHGLKMLNLTNNAFEPSQLRESLAFAAFRAAGIPAARTALSEVSLTVPTKFDHQFIGLYTLVEQVDKSFLKRHFGSANGLLLKPEGLQGLPYLGTEWQPYEEFYRPKTEATEAQKQRLRDLTRLINFASDEQFADQIDTLLNLDNFTRYVAVCAAIVNLDSFVGIGHNYYLYLDPADNRWVFLPWDLNGTFGALGLAGPIDRQIEWGADTPATGYNRLVERVLAIPIWREMYRARLREVLDKASHPDVLRPLIDTLQQTARETLAREAQLPPPELPGMWKVLMKLGEKPPEPLDFITRRHAALRAQLEENRPGKTLTVTLGGPVQRDALARQITKPLFRAVDRDQDKKLSSGEITAAFVALHERGAAKTSNPLTEQSLAAEIVKIFPRPGGLFSRLGPAPRPQPPGFGAGMLLSGYARFLARVPQDALPDTIWPEVTAQLLQRFDTNQDGGLQPEELTNALNWLPPPPIAFDPSQEDHPSEAPGGKPESD
jgi:spore coat protein CotH